MKKTLPVNLGGTVYHIDEDALTEMIISMFYEKND